MGQWRIASTENPIGQPVDAELGFHRGLNVDIREDSEPLGFECSGHDVDRLREALLLQDTVKAVTGGCRRRW